MNSIQLLYKTTVLGVRILAPAYQPPKVKRRREKENDPIFSLGSLLHLACLAAAVPDFIHRRDWLQRCRAGSMHSIRGHWQ
jgi:hypothetical protein